MNRSLVRSSPQSYGQLHNETYLLYMKPNTFITRNRSRVRRSPQSYGRLLNEAHPLYTKIKAFIHRRHRRVRSSPRSYGHLRIPPDASSTHSCPFHFRLFPIAFPFGPRPSPHMKQNVQRCVFLQKRLEDVTQVRNTSDCCILWLIATTYLRTCHPLTCTNQCHDRAVRP